MTEVTLLHLPIILFTTLTTSLGVGRAAASKFAAYGMGTCSSVENSSRLNDGQQMARSQSSNAQLGLQACWRTL